ncbi:MAG: hypothetical protein JSR82_18785 [Verrucomicrobia bacterium]|nr:hypothetical protein [Verrucomicrobiota bacterium]
MKFPVLLCAVGFSSSAFAQLTPSVWDGAGLPGGFFSALAWTQGTHWSTAPNAPVGLGYHAFIESGAVVSQGIAVGALSLTGGQLGDYGIPSLDTYSLFVAGSAEISGTTIVRQRVTVEGALFLGRPGATTILAAGSRLEHLTPAVTNLQGNIELHGGSYLTLFGNDVFVSSPVTVSGTNGVLALGPSTRVTVHDTSFVMSGNVLVGNGILDAQNANFAASYQELSGSPSTVISTAFVLSGTSSIQVSALRNGVVSPVTRATFQNVAIDGTQVTFPALGLADTFGDVTLSRGATIQTSFNCFYLSATVRTGSVFETSGGFTSARRTLLDGGEIRTGTGLRLTGEALSGTGTIRGHLVVASELPVPLQVRPAALGATDAQMLAGTGYGLLQVLGDATFQDADFSLDVGVQDGQTRADLLTASGRIQISGGTLRLQVNGALREGDRFVVLEGLAGLSVNGLSLEPPSGSPYPFAWGVSGNQLFVAVIPEPSVAAMLGALAGGGFVATRFLGRRRSRPVGYEDDQGRADFSRNEPSRRPQRRGRTRG